MRAAKWLLGMLSCSLIHLEATDFGKVAASIGINNMYLKSFILNPIIYYSDTNCVLNHKPNKACKTN